jgi:hypothetical protein
VLDWLVVAVVVPLVDDGVVGAVALPDPDPEPGDVSLPPVGSSAGGLVSGELSAAVLSDGSPAGVALVAEPAAAPDCDTRWVDAGTAALVGFADGLAPLVDSAAEVWAASTDADPLEAAPNAGRPPDDADELDVAGRPCPATGDAAGPGEIAHTMTAHSPTPTPVASGMASRPWSGGRSDRPDAPTGSSAVAVIAGRGPVARFAPGSAR